MTCEAASPFRLSPWFTKADRYHATSMKRPSEKTIFRLLIGSILLMAVGAVVLHFTDDPEPDLSRFTRPTHDPVAYAKVKALCEEFKTRHKEYAPAEPNDPNDDTAEDEAHTLNGLAQRGDAHAVRALRRHLKENEAALATARELVALKSFSHAPIPKMNPLLDFSTPELTPLKQAHRLIACDALLAGIDGKTDTAWAVLGDCLASAQTRGTSMNSLVAGLTDLALEGLTRNTASTLAAFETNPAKLHAFLARMERHAPDPLHFARAAGCEMTFWADSFLPSRGGTCDLVKFAFSTNADFGNAKDLKEYGGKLLRYGRQRWLKLNYLPNATIAEYARLADQIIVSTSAAAPKPAAPNNDGLRILMRNAGGREIVRMFGDALHLVRSFYFRNCAHHDLTRVALALRVYQLEHGGSRPATLTELAPGILPAVPADLFDGKPLRYDAATGKVWSIGTDLKDDRGNEEDDIVLAPAELKPAEPPAQPQGTPHGANWTAHGRPDKTY